MRPKLSIIIITQNEADQIAECLASASWADEIIVVDAESTDDTVAICKNYPVKMFLRPWPGFASQKQFALDQAQNDWVLSLDADERITPELKAEIESQLENPAGQAGFYIPRKGFFLGKWIRHCGWYPGYQLRLFRKSMTRVSEVQVHEGFIVAGPTGHLTAALLHYSHPTLFVSFAKMNSYSGLEALDRKTRRVTWLDFLTHPLSEFLRKYLVKLGFLDGWHGLVLCLVAAYTKMALYMKIWELQQKSEDWALMSVQGPAPSPANANPTPKDR